jgi:SAM-dependent methyltransferase
MSLPSRFYPEIAAGGYSRVDGSIELYTRIRALLEPDMQVLDFGAGRGRAVDPNVFRRQLANLRGACAKVVGVDIDPAVRENPGLDEAVVIEPGRPLPFPDSTFDLVVSDHVFEHVDDPVAVAAELDRVLRPGGWICARTPNRNGYIAWGARLVPNGLHSRVLHRLQPGRQSVDVFPTRYLLNTRVALRRHFPPERYRHCAYGFNTEPAYTGRSTPLWILLWAWLRIAPEALCATWFVFLQKQGRRPVQ